MSADPRFKNTGLASSQSERGDGGMKRMTHWQELTGCSGQCAHTPVATLGQTPWHWLADKRQKSGSWHQSSNLEPPNGVFVQFYMFVLVSCWGWGIPEGWSRSTGAHLTPGCSLPSPTSWGRVCGILFKGLTWERRHCGKLVLEEWHHHVILICALSYMTSKFWKANHS